MASIGKIRLGGRGSQEETQNGEFKSAVAFALIDPAAANRLYHSEDGKWEVEARWNQGYVVARSKESIPPEEDRIQPLVARAIPQS